MGLGVEHCDHRMILIYNDSRGSCSKNKLQPSASVCSIKGYADISSRDLKQTGMSWYGSDTPGSLSVSVCLNKLWWWILL